MKEVKKAIDVKFLLGEKYPKGRPKGVFPQQRQIVTHEGEKMKGLVFGSGLNKEQIFEERARGNEHQKDVALNPDYYMNEP